MSSLKFYLEAYHFPAHAFQKMLKQDLYDIFRVSTFLPINRSIRTPYRLAALEKLHASLINMFFPEASQTWTDRHTRADIGESEMSQLQKPEDNFWWSKRMSS